MPEQEPAVRATRSSDLPEVENLLKSSKLPLAGVRDSFGDFVVAECCGDLIGVAGLEVCADDALLRSVAVKPEWRSKGIGHALVTRAIADAESKQLRALYLLTETAEDWFPSFGFTKISRADVPQPVKATGEFTKA